MFTSLGKLLKMLSISLNAQLSLVIPIIPGILKSFRHVLYCCVSHLNQMSELDLCVDSSNKLCCQMVPWVEVSRCQIGLLQRPQNWSVLSYPLICVVRV
jgi:hypothetical protein